MLGLSTPQTASLLVCAAAAVVALGAEIVSYRIVNQGANLNEDTGWDRPGRTTLWAVAGVIVSGVFLVAILATAGALIIAGETCG